MLEWQDGEGQSGEVRPTQYVKIRAWCDVPCDVMCENLTLKQQICQKRNRYRSLQQMPHILVLYLVDWGCSWWII